MDDILAKTVELNAPLAALNDLPPKPDFIGPYKIESLLSQGGMSLLYLAISPQLSHPVVVKVVLPKYLKNEEVLNRLLKEAKILSATSHPNIVKLYDLGKSEHGLYIVMEYIQGISLHQFIKTKSLTHQRAIEIILQIAYALSHLHSQRIIHRDLKPNNILLTESGEIKVIDFGISEFITSKGIEDKTKETFRMGTPHYMSPEQKEHPEEIPSYTSDIFSLGIIAYELYLGQLAQGIIQPSILPQGLARILGKALEINPSNRYQTIIDFIADLTEFFHHIEGEEKRTSPEELMRCLEETRAMLLSRSIPKWANIEIGSHLKEGEIHAFYLDFLQLLPNRFCIFFAQPIHTGSHAFFLASMLRGMVRMTALKTPSQPVPQFLDDLNKALFNEQLLHSFDFSVLFLDLGYNLLAFSSSKPAALCHSSQSGSKLHFLDTDNAPLGQHSDAMFSEVKENWQTEDILLLASFPITLSQIHSHAKLFLLDSNILAKKMLDALTPSPNEGLLLAIKRL